MKAKKSDLPRWGDHVTVTAISHLGCEANWAGFPQCTPGSGNGSAIYQPIPGWGILQTKVITHTSVNASQAVSVIAAGGHFISRVDIDMAYSLVIDIAYKEGKDDVALNLKQQWSKHVREVYEWESNKNTIQAVVHCEAHGDCANQMGGSINISVEADLIYIGEPNAGILIRTLLEDNDLEKSNALGRLPRPRVEANA